MPLDYSKYTVKQSGYCHLPLEQKMAYFAGITGFEQVSICEDATEHYEYWKRNQNWNPDDCCNLRK
ncbi:MAG: hypothetical protein PHG19_12365 [Anaerotignum sp.]|nr:hypothetical protein [Anaerotignum sp.]